MKEQLTSIEEFYTPCVLVQYGYSPIERIDRNFNHPVILCIKDLPQGNLSESSMNVYLDSCEPSVWCCPEDVVNNREDLDLILTKRTSVLENAKCKSVLFPFGTSWTKNTKEKVFGVSFLMTSQQIKGMDGYKIRHDLWGNQEEIIIPKKFYNSSRRPLLGEKAKNSEPIGENQNSKNKLFDEMFSIIIENTKETNYFTEKLIDCLQSKTVPIYYGCPNISDYFNTEGMIVVDSAQDIIDACNNVTEDTYENMKEHIHTNYKKSEEYALPFYKRVFDAIEENLKLGSIVL